MKNLILTGKITAGLSFIIGTILCALYLYFDHPSSLENFGFVFILISFWVNFILLIILLISLLFKTKLRLEIAKTCGIILLNIPIAIGYFMLILSSLDFSNDF